jgi:hypothetical protein
MGTFILLALIALLVIVVVYIVATIRLEKQSFHKEPEAFGNNEQSRRIASLKGACARAAGFPYDTEHGYSGENAGAWLTGWQYCNSWLSEPGYKPAAPPARQPAGIVEKMIDAMLEAQGYIKKTFAEQTIGDQQWFRDGMTPAAQVCIADRDAAWEKAAFAVLDEWPLPLAHKAIIEAIKSRLAAQSPGAK